METQIPWLPQMKTGSGFLIGPCRKGNQNKLFICLKMYIFIVPNRYTYHLKRVY